MNKIKIESITNIHLLAFGAEGKEISELAEKFLNLPETISIDAYRDHEIVGNVLFTPFTFEEHKDKKCYLLAPLGVLPQYRNGGIGKELIESGINHLKSLGTDAIFVLGDPAYYSKYGFGKTNKKTPFPELLTIPEAWMMYEANPRSMNHVDGKTSAIEPFMIPELWDTSGHDPKSH